MSVSLDGVSFVPEKENVEYHGGNGASMGKDAFLKLLVAQMQNQDPLNPQSNEEFIGQLSQFSQVEQLVNLNTGFETLFMTMNSLNNTSMTQLLGNKVVSYGNQFHHDGSAKEIDLHYETSAPSNATKLVVKDDTGGVVWSGAVEPLDEGQGHITWTAVDHDGKPLPEGNYSFSFEASSPTGETIEVNELMVGVVDGMSFVEGVPRPSISGIEFDLSMIIRVETADADAE
jgi:flagellar basal-body rod modification protein FlgD